MNTLNKLSLFNTKSSLNKLHKFNFFSLHNINKFSYINSVNKNNSFILNVSNKKTFCDDTHSDFQKQSKLKIDDSNAMEAIDTWIKENTVVLFMKGNKELPRCGFSNYLIQVMNFYKIKEFKDVNVLESDVLRESVKKYSDWPTFPQLYVKGELVGGCDIVKEMHESGAFEDLVKREKLSEEI